MKLIRKGTFETNSSSTHTLVVPHIVKDDDYSLYDSLDHDYNYGRSPEKLIEDWDEKLAYAYMLLKTNYEWSNSNEKWKPEVFTSKEELDNFKDRVWKIWEEVVNMVVSNETKYDIDTQKHIPLTQEEIEKEKKKYLNTNKDDFRHPNPKDIFRYVDRDGDDGNLTGDDSCHIIMDRYGCYVDHANDIDQRFIEKIKTDDEFLKKFLFNRKSYITIGGDEYRGYNIKTIGYEYDYESHYINNGTEECPQYEDVGEFWDKLREYEKENDVFLKGN